MGSFILFLFFSVFYYFKIDKIKKNNIIYILSFSGVFLFFYLLIATFLLPNDLFAKYFPLTLVILFFIIIYSKWKYYFNVKRTETFLILFLFLNVVGVIMTSIYLGVVQLPIRQLLSSFVFFIPISILGVYKLFSSVFKKNTMTNLLFSIFLTVALFFIIDDLIDGTQTQRFHVQKFGNVQSEELRLINQFLFENLTKNSNLASNEPGFAFMYTGLNSIGLPAENTSIKSLETFFDFYDISHIVVYNSNYAQIPNVYSLMENLNTSRTYKFFYDKIFENGDSQVYKIQNISNASIEHPIAYASLGLNLMEQKNLQLSNEILEQVSSVNYKERKTLENICNFFFVNEQYDYAAKSCENLENQHGQTFFTVEKLAPSYALIDYNEGIDNILGFYFNDMNNFNQQKSDSFILMYNSINDIKNSFFISSIYEKILELTEHKEIQQSIPIYKILFLIETSNENLEIVYIHLISTASKIDTSDDKYILLETYNFIIKNYENKIDKAQNHNYDTQLILENQLFTALIDKAEILLYLDDINKARNTYNKILDFDRFNPLVWEKIGFSYEMQGNFPLALSSYEKAVQFELDETKKAEFIDKVSNLEYRASYIKEEQELILILNSNYDVLNRLYSLKPLENITYDEVDSSIWIRLGITYQQFAETSLAISSYENALKADPSNKQLSIMIDKMNKYRQETVKNLFR